MPVSAIFITYFIIYAFAGWLWELIFIYATERRWHWRGFLTIPLLPIYGLSALGILLVVQPYIHDPFLVFITATVIVSVIEYITSFILEKAFRITLWDYQKMPLNLNGRVSLFTSLGFGVLALFLLYEIHPHIQQFVTSFSPKVLQPIIWTIFAIILIDFTNSLSILLKLRSRSFNISDSFENVINRMNTRIYQFQKRHQAIRRRLEQWQKLQLVQISKAFPSATRKQPIKKNRHSIQ